MWTMKPRVYLHLAIGLTGWTLLACSDTTGPASLGALRAIATGWSSSEHTCGITTTGAAYCWGTNFFGALGRGTRTLEPGTTPEAVVGGLTFSEIGVGQELSCALASDGSAYCWGSRHYFDVDLNRQITETDSVPVRVGGGFTFRSLSVGWGHACGLTAEGVAYCWGAIPGSPGSPTPTPVPGDLRFETISVAHDACGITTGGLTYCWGVLDTLPVLVPVAVGLVSISVGGEHKCGLTADGTAYCWGQNNTGQLGRGFFSISAPDPKPVATPLRFTRIDAGALHTCAVTVDSEAYCWGDNLTWELGDPAIGHWSVPRPVVGGLRFRDISAGDAYTCAVTVDGAGYCWGDNGFGQLGTGTAGGYRPKRIMGF
jgi:alpha-tubulin suppressor-like RCC1 family protein